MTHVLEPATSGRAKCRGCAQAIPKGAVRLGERLPNPYAEEGDMTLWYHPRCGAFKRPDVFLAGLEGESVDLEDREELSDAARLGTTHRRLPRVDGVQKSSTGRARCRCCREPIAKGSWRIPLVFYEEGYFNPSGFAHLGCSSEYFGTTDILARLIHFSDGLTEGDIAEIRALLEIEE